MRRLSHDNLQRRTLRRQFPVISGRGPAAVSELFRRLGANVGGIAVVGARLAARFGAITVSLISKTPLETFDTRADALAWLDSLP